MIDYKAYNKINELIAKGNFTKLQEFLDEEKNKYYLKIAREGLRKYLELKRGLIYGKPYYEMINGKLAITDQYTGGYLLDSNEILFPIEKKNLYYSNKTVRKTTLDLMERIYFFEEKCVFKVNKVKNNPDKGNEIIMSSKENSGEYLFDKNLYEITNAILGDDTTYTVNKNSVKPFCLIKSSKGIGILAGIRGEDKKLD